jgi:hypothetical protein
VSEAVVSSALNAAKRIRDNAKTNAATAKVRCLRMSFSRILGFERATAALFLEYRLEGWLTKTVMAITSDSGGVTLRTHDFVDFRHEV